jgi:hypothetical protein
MNKKEMVAGARKNNSPGDFQDFIMCLCNYNPERYEEFLETDLHRELSEIAFKSHYVGVIGWFRRSVKGDKNALSKKEILSMAREAWYNGLSFEISGINSKRGHPVVW